jgi:hypothetical protein
LQQAKVPTVTGMQPQMQLGATPVPVSAGNMAASHVAQRLEHLAAQAQARQSAGSAGPVPPLALDKALPIAAGPASGSALQASLSIGPQGPSSARSTSTSLALSGYTNLDALVQQATAAAAAAAAAGSGPQSAGAPGVLLPAIRTEARVSAGVGASHTASPSTVRGYTPSAAGIPPATTPSGMSECV